MILKYLGLDENTTLYKEKDATCAGEQDTRTGRGIRVLMVNEELRHLIAEGADTLAIRDAAIRSGMKP
jgi:hypothetical protein